MKFLVAEIGWQSGGYHGLEHGGCCATRNTRKVRCALRSPQKQAKMQAAGRKLGSRLTYYLTTIFSLDPSPPGPSPPRGEVGVDSPALAPLGERAAAMCRRVRGLSTLTCDTAP